jgi:membrane protease YdiL (CAAX protease family)
LARPVPRNRKAGRILEAAILFGLIPGSVAAGWLKLPLMPLLWTATFYCLWEMGQDGDPDPGLWRRPRLAPGEGRRTLLTFALVTALLIAAVRVLRPEALFAYPRGHPWRWALVVLLYPVCSALPQEIIFRAFFFRRYRVLFGNGAGLAAASALAFGITHLAFHNWVAVALTLPGGLLFARSYRRNGSLLFVVCEHALYGCMVFTIGLGGFLTEATLRVS